MGCPHHNKAYIKRAGKWVCPDCGYVSPYQPTDHADLLKENIQLRKILEDICECHEGLSALIEEARNILNNS